MHAFDRASLALGCRGEVNGRGTQGRVPEEFAKALQVASTSEDRGRERSTEAMERVSAIRVIDARLPEEAAALECEVAV